jgi:riboflavin synthase
MFTGIIQELGEVININKISGGLSLQLKADKIALDSNLGDSISVNGVCLTVVKKEGNKLSFDLSDETLRKTNLGNLRIGEKVNLEPSLTPQSKIGGHFVTGHIDTTGIIRSKCRIGEMMKIGFEVPEDIMKFLVEKGSIAVDGISLTIVDILRKGFTVVIIPHTAKLTTLGFKDIGDTVNIEADILGKYVVNFLNIKDNKTNKDAKILQTLTKSGYIGEI